MKPTVLTLDTLCDRSQVFRALIRGLTPSARLDFLDWAISFARATVANPLLREAKADRRKMLAMTKAAEAHDDAANLLHANETYVDITTLAHHFGVEWLPLIEELEGWAMGREPTPVLVAVASWRRRVQPSGSIHIPGTGDSARTDRLR